MERRRALVVAGTLAATLAMAAGAMAVNLGLLGADHDPVGDLTPTAIQPTADERPARAGQQRPRVRVIVQDIPVSAGGGTSGSGTGGGAPAEAPVAAATTPAPTATPTPPVTSPVTHDDDDVDDHEPDVVVDDQDDVDHPDGDEIEIDDD